MQDRARARNHFWTIAAGGLAAIALLGVTLTRMSEGFDRVSLEREQVVVDHGLSYRFEEIGRSLVPLVVWDDAVVHLDNRFDRAWTRDNIGTFLQVTEGFQFSWVLDADDRPIYGMDGGQEADLSSFGALARSTSSIVSRVRQAEAARNATAAPQQTAPQAAIVATATDVIGSDLYVLSAALVQPDFGTARISGRRAPVVVTGIARHSHGAASPAPTSTAAAMTPRFPVAHRVGGCVCVRTCVRPCVVVWWRCRWRWRSVAVAAKAA